MLLNFLQFCIDQPVEGCLHNSWGYHKSSKWKCIAFSRWSQKSTDGFNYSTDWKKNLNEYQCYATYNDPMYKRRLEGWRYTIMLDKIKNLVHLKYQDHDSNYF